MSSHCTNSSMRECAGCPAGTFTRGENGVQQCHRCQSHCQAPLVEKSSCTATTDRVCVCPPATYAKDEECLHAPVCLPGWGVRKQGSKLEDVRCRRCLRGTFSDVASQVLRCQMHTDCQALGLQLLLKGTDKTDNVCGTSPAHPVSSSSLLSSPSLRGKNVHTKCTKCLNNVSIGYLTERACNTKDHNHLIT